MFYFLSRLALSFYSPATPAPMSPAAALMERADQSVGTDPQHAFELREAASAWLRVVR